jgi:hypothetical protein
MYQDKVNFFLAAEMLPGNHLAAEYLPEEQKAGDDESLGGAMCFAFDQ